MKSAFHSLRKWGLFTALFTFVLIGFTNCNSSKQVAYFQDVPDTTGVMKRVRNTPFVEPRIKKGDLLHIEVTTIDAEIGGISHQEQTNEGGGSTGGAQQVSGYMVDKNGDIEVPIIGKLQVESMTTMELKEAIRERALKYYKDPMVNVRIANFYITILGQVRAPGRYIVNSEKVSILDAIGLAGDLDLGGMRENVMVIREENGESVFTRVDLNSTDIYQSKYFYLQSGDMIYVEPLKAVATAGTSDKRADRWVTLSLAMISLLLAVATFVIRLN